MAENENAVFEVATSPHVHKRTQSTAGIMIDVLIALIPPVLAGSLIFGMLAVKQLLICLVSALVAEFIFNAMRKKPFSLKDGSAAITGVILALSIPASAPWYVGCLGSFMAIGLGKIIFGGLGFNLFNPAMVGRAFVMIAFPALLGASAYIIPQARIDVLTTATPLTAFKMEGVITSLQSLVVGTTNGSIGETSALACLVGGVYLCVRRTAAWQIPAGVIVSAALISALLYRFDMAVVIHELTSGALIFGAFYIATDPVTSPVTPKGRWIFGIFIGCMIMLLRKLSGYPEGVMFAVLMANMITPLVNRWTIPVPVGGPVPERK